MNLRIWEKKKFNLTHTHPQNKQKHENLMNRNSEKKTHKNYLNDQSRYAWNVVVQILIFMFVCPNMDRIFLAFLWIGVIANMFAWAHTNFGWVMSAFQTFTYVTGMCSHSCRHITYTHTHKSIFDTSFNLNFYRNYQISGILHPQLMHNTYLSHLFLPLVHW